MADEREAVEDLREAEKDIEAKVDEAGKRAEKDAEKRGLSEDEVNERVQKARKEEKDKLYPQLEEVKNALKEVQQTLRAEREEKEAIKKKAEEEAEAERVKQLSADEQTKEVLHRLEEQLREEREARERFKQELEQEKKSEALRRYRAEAIQAANIPKPLQAMVNGNSKEEIDEAVKYAKASHEEIVEQAKEEARKQFRKGLSTANPDTEALEEDELENQLGRIDEEKYQRDPVYRERVKEMLATAYQRGARR